MELNITFPIRQTEKTFAEIMLKAATIKLTSFIVKNSTKGKSIDSFLFRFLFRCHFLKKHQLTVENEVAN